MSDFVLILLIFDTLISFGLLIIKIGRVGYKRESYDDEDDFNPRVLVILPVKGIDFEMEYNLKSLKEQSYSNYRIIAVADSEDDKSLDLIRKEGIEFMISDASCNNCSGKVRAIYSALLRFKEFDCYVIADSDIRVDRNWLNKLIRPLSRNDIGISTTFPKFFPRGGFWSHFKMYWGMIGESMMESKITRFAWGGSMAFRSDLIGENELKEFSSSVSDDIALLNIAKRKGLQIAYVKEATVFVHSPDSFRVFLEWSNRQTALSISSSNKVFIFGMVYYISASMMILSSIIMIIFGYYLYIITLLPVFYISYSNFRNAPERDGLFLVYNILLYFFYIYNLISGKLKKSIIWRGRIYHIKSKI